MSPLLRIPRCPRLTTTPVLVVALTLLGAVAAGEPPAVFRFTEESPQSLKLWEAERPVLVYNHGVISRAGVPADRARSTYIHPLYGPDGEVLTDDFPADHYHHRGLFWAWPHVQVGGKHYDLWMLTGVRQQFERWLAREADADGKALLAVENGWYVGDRRIVREQAWFRVHPATPEGRAMDVEFTWVPTDEAVTLAGAEGKSYGGLTLRYAPRTQTAITTPLGQGTNDLAMTRLAWADLSAQFAGASDLSGAAVFISPQHPDYAPMWLTRHYGCLCVGWPGVEPKAFPAGRPIRAGYRVWIHRGAGDPVRLARAYDEYKASQPGAWLPATSTAGTGAATGPQPVAAELREDRVVIRVNGQPFTEYRFTAEAKYPYFYPVLGPRSAKTVTVHRTEPYPHHSSIFFGCDRVNDGDYWQEGLERGRIASKGVRLASASGDRVEFEQDCTWERPGAEPPFSDHRRIVVSAPGPDVRLIDFDVTLTARRAVKIEKTNHSLFAVRVAPELSVQGGGRLVNAGGDLSEKETFGKTSPWADYGGNHHGVEEGVAILSHPSNRWFPEPWFTRDYGFMSPTPLNWLGAEGLTFQPGETLRLRYRVVVHAGPTPPAMLADWFAAWSR